LAGLTGPRWWRRFLFRLGERYFIDPVVCPFINAWRSELGLTPVRRIVRWWNSKFGVLCMFPEWYGPPQPDWPSPLMQTDFPLWNDLSAEPLASKVEQFLHQGDRPIVFTPGTGNLHGRGFFESAVLACQHLNRRGIFLTPFVEQVPANLPSSIAHFSYVPLDRLLPRAAAFVHHGGVGSTSQAMLASIPQVLMPMAHDQFDNAERIRTLSIGESIPSHRFHDRRLVEALKRLLTSSRVASACSAIAARLASRDGLQRSATAIEERIRADEVSSH
jgi:UDP:flavonoid glycosyltransferase YjiC (YdhE family)